jgi:hypothetical protein
MRNWILITSLIIGGCASIENIRDIEPVFQAKAKQDVISFRNCVFDALAGNFQGVNKTANGVVIGADPSTVGVLIEQEGGNVTAYKVPYSLLRSFDLPRDAAQACNDDPDAGLFGR